MVKRQKFGIGLGWSRDELLVSLNETSATERKAILLLY